MVTLCVSSTRHIYLRKLCLSLARALSLTARTDALDYIVGEWVG
jgi:hypothetical protein